jgi:hypothetical protein
MKAERREGISLATDWRAGTGTNIPVRSRSFSGIYGSNMNRLRKRDPRYINAVAPRVHTSEHENLRGENRVLLVLND